MNLVRAPLAHVDFIEIGLEDVFLGMPGLGDQSEKRLFQLARDFFSREKKRFFMSCWVSVLPPSANLLGTDILPERASRASDADSGVFEEITSSMAMTARRTDTGMSERLTEFCVRSRPAKKAPIFFGALSIFSRAGVYPDR